jgi:hypothetical protein
MTDFGMLRRGTHSTPRTVSLTFDDESITIVDSAGTHVWLPLKDLRVKVEQGGSLVLGRRLTRNWSLHLTGNAARTVRQLLPAKEARFTRFRRWAFRNPKLAGLAFVAPFLALEHIPGSMLLPVTTPSLAKRLDSGVLRYANRGRCNRPGSQEALVRLARALTPATKSIPDIVATNYPSFLVTAVPGDHIIVSRSALVEIPAEAMAALLAHELAHLEGGEVVPAIARAEESNFLWRLIVGPNVTSLAAAYYTKGQEAAADKSAQERLRAAGIPLGPAADFFTNMDHATASGLFFGQEHSERHPGLAGRAAAWRMAAAGEQEREYFDRDTSDALFNACQFAQTVML